MKLERIGANGTCISNLKIEDFFTEIQTATEIWYIEKPIGNGLILCRNNYGWGRCFNEYDIVYPI